MGPGHLSGSLHHGCADLNPERQRARCSTLCLPRQILREAFRIQDAHGHAAGKPTKRRLLYHTPAAWSRPPPCTEFEAEACAGFSCRVDTEHYSLLTTESGRMRATLEASPAPTTVSTTASTLSFVCTPPSLESSGVWDGSSCALIVRPAP